MVGLFFFFYPRVGAWFFVFSCVFQVAYLHRLEIIAVSRFWAWIPFLLAIMLTGPLLAKEAIERYGIFRDDSPLKKLYIALIMFMIGGFAACVLNGCSLVIAVFGLRHILLFVIGASLFWAFRPLRLTIEHFMRFVVWVAIIQIPFVIVQRISFTVFGTLLRSETQDLISGTFGTYNSLCFVQLLAVGIIIYWARRKKAIVGKYVLPLMVIVISPLFISNARAAFLFLVAILTLLAFRFWQKIVEKLPYYLILIPVVAAVLYFGVVVVFWGFQEREYNRDIKEQYTLEYIIDYVSKPAPPAYQYVLWKADPYMGRLAAIVKATELIKEKPSRLLFGLGPGNTQQSQVFGRDGSYFQAYGILAGLNRNQFSLVIAEYGLLGLAVYCALFLWLWKIVQRIREIDLSEYKLFSDTYAVMLVLILLFSVYSAILTDFATIVIIGYFIAVLQERTARIPLNHAGVLV